MLEAPFAGSADVHHLEEEGIGTRSRTFGKGAAACWEGSLASHGILREPPGPNEHAQVFQATALLELHKILQLLDLFFVHFSVRDFMNGVLDNDLKEPQDGFVYLWHDCSLFTCAHRRSCARMFHDFEENDYDVITDIIVNSA